MDVYVCVIQKREGKGEEQVNDTQLLDHFSATMIWIERSMLERSVEKSISPGIMDLISLPRCSLEHVCQTHLAFSMRCLLQPADD
jgi:hypothetical protein